MFEGRYVVCWRKQNDEVLYDEKSITFHYQIRLAPISDTHFIQHGVDAYPLYQDYYTGLTLSPSHTTIAHGRRFPLSLRNTLFTILYQDISSPRRADALP